MYEHLREVQHAAGSDRGQPRDPAAARCHVRRRACLPVAAVGAVQAREEGGAWTIMGGTIILAESEHNDRMISEWALQWSSEPAM